ncbi:hypothetical protein PNEG_04294 [Pneumocystis murina B123]|uniref:Major facilitator superfamily (MFS) profile domain-containing protein n=1 Tax=Pneumocystis murina (strain B123) TaxID=1069680 RepID=A0A0W4ZX16_PNEMU|nr:hypothetical protein PNEG_04294 [Pneumocystis murina B123]KTW32907.1 hypothetical protein PNEG_04294 [Pneumocystis murina B123]
MKFRKQADPIELSFLIARKENNANDCIEEKYQNDYASFFTKTQVQLNDKREQTVKIVLLFLIISSCFFENIFNMNIYTMQEGLNKGNTQSSSLIKGFIIINPIIPIIFGLLVEKYDAGTSLFPIYLTGIIFFSQCISIIATLLHWKYIVILGLFVSGLCMNPLVIVQETLLIETFQEDNLGFYISIMLSVGKLISFISSFFINTFSEHSIYHIKILFIVSSALSLFSFSKRCQFIFGVVFGTTPFIYFLNKIEYTHFLKNITATDISSAILLLSVALYPIIGWLNDNYGHRLVILLISLFMSLISFISLLLPIRYDTFFITLFSVGQSVSSIILVLLTIYISKNASTIFGFCKSMEIIGNDIMQSVIHIILNFNKKKELTNTDINAIIMLFSILNMFSLVFLAAFYRDDNIYNKKYINHCLYNLFHKKSKMMYQDIIFRSKEIALKLTQTYLGFIVTGLILNWILYVKVFS